MNIHRITHNPKTGSCSLSARAGGLPLLLSHLRTVHMAQVLRGLVCDNSDEPGGCGFGSGRFPRLPDRKGG